MTVTKEEVRQIVREELERILTLYLDAKTTATAIKHGLYYSDCAPSPLRNKSSPQHKSSLRGVG